MANLPERRLDKKKKKLTWFDEKQDCDASNDPKSVKSFNGDGQMMGIKKRM